MCLPTPEGNFHGDYLMDGHDLEVTSTKTSNSIVQVLSKAHTGAAQAPTPTTPAPNFAAIMADPMAGPAWKLMMADYHADLEKAKHEVNAQSKGETDGQTKFDGQAVLDDIEKNVFGEGIDPKTLPKEHDAKEAGADLSVVTTKRRALKGIVDDVNHYLTTAFGYNANLGPGGLDDNLNAPLHDPNDKKAPEEANKDWVSDGSKGPGFDICQVEGKYQLFTLLGQSAGDYLATLQAALGNHHLKAGQRAAIAAAISDAQGIQQLAAAWKSQSDVYVSESVVDVGKAGKVKVKDNNVAWGAGHPEWISNHEPREKWRLKVIPKVAEIVVKVSHDPVAKAASFGKPHSKKAGNS